MRETKKKDDTRQRLIEAGAEIIHRQGFSGTGIQEVLDACGVPKGSFYHYFKSKQDFGLAVLEFQAERTAANILPLLSDPLRPPLERLRAFFDAFLARFCDPEQIVSHAGCPIGNLVQELAPVNPAFRTRLDAIMTGLEDILAAQLRQAQAQDQIPARLDPEQTARFIAASWQGAILRAKASEDAAPLALCRDFILGELLRQGDGRRQGGAAPGE